MKFREILFWSHLVAGVIAGIFIFIMSATGVLLMYEHAIINKVSNGVSLDVAEGAKPLPVDVLAAQALERSEGARMVMLSFDNRADAPLTVYQIGMGQFSVDPYTGAEVANPAASVEAFLHEIVDLHRWLGAEGEGRKVARAITGASNLIFLFIIVSGLYLWLPKVRKWVFFRMNLVFLRKPPTSKARDYNWHHVLGIWSLIPLFFLVLSGVVMSYPWANALLYQAFGEAAPRSQGPAFLSGGSMDGKGADIATVPREEWASLQDAFDAAKASDPGWTSINVVLPAKAEETSVRLMVNNGAGYLPEQRTTLTYVLPESRIAKVETYDDMSAGRKARMFMRFIHTGEQLGFIGSTIAGLASLAACVLVYTGLALAWRRLVTPALKRRQKARQEAEKVPQSEG